MSEPLTFLSLFSGIGGIDLGLERAGLRCVGQVEIDPFASAVLEKHWPDLPRWRDVRDVTVESVLSRCGRPSGIVGGFACQDVSCAGKGAGLAKATRSGLTWRQMFRLIRRLRPDWLLIENVPALRSRGADRVIAVLERIGYACWPVVVGAEHVGLPHKRHRVWIVAHRQGEWGGRNLADAHGADLRQQRECAGRDGAAPVVAGWGGESLADPRRQQCNSGLRQSIGGADWRTAFDRTGAQCGSVADPASGGRTGRQGDEAGSIGNRNAAGRVEIDDQFAGQDHPDVGNSECDGLRASRRSDAEVSHEGRTGILCPARPGQPQHEWEASRLAQFGMGRTAHGSSERLVRFGNRNALKALGNSVVWVIPYLIGKWIAANFPQEVQVTA